MNDGPWPKNLPADEQDSVETFPEAFTRAISKETTLNPQDLHVDVYRRAVAEQDPDGPDTLEGTPWEDVWRQKLK